MPVGVGLRGCWFEIANLLRVLSDAPGRPLAWSSVHATDGEDVDGLLNVVDLIQDAGFSGAETAKPGGAQRHTVGRSSIANQCADCGPNLLGGLGITRTKADQATHRGGVPDQGVHERHLS